MEFNLGFLIISVLKIATMLGWIYGLLWALGHTSRTTQVLGTVLAFAVVQFALSVPIGEAALFNDFDQGLLFQACAMAMVVLGLNLIYGFNGQFSLGQWGFYGIGAYAAADVTYRWTGGDARGLLVLGIGVILGGLTIWGVSQLLRRYAGMPVLSAFTLYLIGSVAAGGIAVWSGGILADLLSPLFGTTDAPGLLGSDPALHLVFFLAVIFAGVFAAEVSFLFGLPVLTLGSDYFGIATLGFTIVVNTLMINSDTILPFPEMKGGRGMIGIPKLTTWFWAFLFLVLVIIIMRNLIHSSTGRAIMSVREDETAAKAMGIDVASNKLLAFVIGSFFAGIGGGVYAHFIGFLSPGTFDFLVGFNPLIIVVFGGLGSMSGSIAASFGWIFFLEGLLRVILGQMGTDAPTWRFVLYPIALLLLMLLRPQGLLGRTEWGFLRAPEAEPRDSGEPRPTPVPTGKETREPTMSGAPTIDHETPTLHITGLTKLFGGLRAVSDFDLTVRRGELAGLIGPNGAGKTTVFNMISGLYLPTAGDIQFQGEGTVGMEPFEITQLGIGRTFQNIRLFPNLSVLDNVRIAYHPHAGYGMFDAILRSRRFDARERELTERAQDFLAIFKLERIQGELAKNLPYGQQRRVEIARALASEPRLLLLDEPAAGMNPAEIVTLMELIHFIRDRFDLTILLIEHQMRVVMGICQHITVMDFGQVIARGTPKEIQGNVRCIEAYLGKGAVSAA